MTVIGRGVLFVLLALGMSGVAATAANAGDAVPGRAFGDRPDDHQGPQVHLIYAIPHDGVDRQYDVDGVISQSFTVAQEWLANQTGGRRLRLDTYRGQPDITFVRLPERDARLASHGVNSRDEIEALLRAMGFKASSKLYEVFYEGSSTVCGGGAWPPALPGHVAVVDVRGTPPGYPGCDTNPFAVPGKPAGYREMDELHEILHTLGMVPDCAPHSIHNGHVNDSPTDLMYQGPQPWDTSHMVLDFGRDDYFDAHVAGCIDFSQSAFLEGGNAMPPAWQKPPPWPAVCVVPRLSRLTLARARRALRAAYCRLGRISYRGHGARRRPRRVARQSVPAEAVHKAGLRVNVTLK